MSTKGKHHYEPHEPGPATEKPTITAEHRAKAKEVFDSYDADRPTIVHPGTGGSISGTAVNEWVDDDGNSIYGEGKGGAKKESPGKPLPA
ncbi:MAG: hypothetical protein ACM4D3_02345 [Candidatus Sericytochromatia bacterium]